jgi:O-antigen/teichoic acid export membrane protein
VQTTAKRVTFNTIAFFFARVIDILAGILIVVMVARYLGVKDFGDFAFITALVGFLVSVTYFGLERVAIRDIARDRAQANASLGAVLVVRWLLSGLVIVAIAGYILLSSLSPSIALATIVATVSELVWASGSVFSCTFKAFEKMHLETVTTFIFRMASIALIGLVIYVHGNFVLLFGAICAANVLRSLTAIYFSRTLSVRPQITVNYRLWKLYAKEAFILGAVVVLALGTLKTGVIALKFMRDTKEVALFQSAQTIVLQMQVLPLSIAMALFPLLSQLSVSSRERLGRVSGAALKYLFIASVPFAIILFVFSETIIGIIFGADFAGASSVLGIMSWCVIPLFMSSIMEFVLISLNRQDDVAKAWGISFIVNAALNYLLIGPFGARGAAIAVLLSFILLTGIQYVFLTNRVEQVAFSRTFSRLLSPLGLVLLFLYLFKLQGLISQIVGAASAIALFFGALVTMAMISLSELKSFASSMGGPGTSSRQ